MICILIFNESATCSPKRGDSANVNKTEDQRWSQFCQHSYNVLLRELTPSSFSVICRPVPSASSGNVLEMSNLEPHSKHTKSDSAY